MPPVVEIIDRELIHSFKKEPINIKGLVQPPRPDGEWNGRISKYRLHISDDGKTWRVVTEGEWPDSKLPQRVWLTQPVLTRFIRLEAVAYDLLVPRYSLLDTAGLIHHHHPAAKRAQRLDLQAVTRLY